MCHRTSSSKHLLMTGASAIEWKSLRLVMGDFLGDGDDYGRFQAGGMFQRQVEEDASEDLR